MDPNGENSLSQDVGFMALMEGMRGDEPGSSSNSPDWPWRENNMAWEREEEEEEEEPAFSPASHISTNSKDTDQDDAGLEGGEVDEGFDEEFDIDPQEENASSKPPAAKEELPATSSSSEVLTLTDIQQLLGAGEADGTLDLPIIQPSLFEDFDPGVDVLDMEHPCLNDIVEPLKSPAQAASPYSNAASPAATVGVELSCNSMDHFDCLPGPSDGLGMFAGLEDFSQVDDAGSTDFLDIMYQPSLSPMSSSACDTGMEASICGYTDCQSVCSDRRALSPSPSPSHYTPSPPPPPMQNVMLGGASLDIQGPQLGGVAYPLPGDVSHPLQSISCGWPRQSDTMTTTTSGVLSAPISVGHGTVPAVDSGTQVVASGGGSCSTLCSVGSLTTASSSSFGHSRSPSPAPPHCGGDKRSAPSPLHLQLPVKSKGGSTSSSEEHLGPSKTGQLVDMPFYQFKKIVDDPSLQESQRMLVKTIRRRGKNKVAAKNCRQRKLGVLLCLQQEIDRLKAEKSAVVMRNQSLEREIDLLRKRCTQPRIHR